MPLVEQIHYRHHIHSGVVFIRRVDVVVEGYEANVVGREDVVNVLTHLNVISPETGEVFADDQVYLSRFRVLQQARNTRTIKC